MFDKNIKTFYLYTIVSHTQYYDYNAMHYGNNEIYCVLSIIIYILVMHKATSNKPINYSTNEIMMASDKVFF